MNEISDERRRELKKKYTRPTDPVLAYEYDLMLKAEAKQFYSQLCKERAAARARVKAQYPDGVPPINRPPARKPRRPRIKGYLAYDIRRKRSIIARHLSFIKKLEQEIEELTLRTLAESI